MRKLILGGFLFLLCVLPVHAALSFPDTNFDYGIDGSDAKNILGNFAKAGSTDLSADGLTNAIDFGAWAKQPAMASAANWWPMQLGNFWTYEVTEFSASQFALWEQNFQGARTGVSVRNCSGAFGEYKNTTLGSKAAMEVVPNMGYNRFYTSRYVQFFKEKNAAYHAPMYCDLNYGSSTSWNLQWYTHNPYFFANQFWYGSEGGVRFYRSPTNLEANAEISATGSYLKNEGKHYGGGRFPAYDSTWAGLPGYTYIPLNQLINTPNNAHDVVSDMDYTFGGGTLSNVADFRYAINTFLNDYQANILIWNLEFIPLKAGDVLTKNVIPASTDVLSVIFFEPLTRDPAQPANAPNEEIACENWYFAKDIGLVKLTHSIVAVLPNDPDLAKTRQLCFSLFQSDFNKSTDPAKRNVDFSRLAPYQSDINLFKYSYPKNSFEITSYKIYPNPSADNLGFHSPTGDFVGSSTEYFSNGRFWSFDQFGTLAFEGNLFDAWKNNGIASVGGIYPWTNNGPDAVTNGPDVFNLFGQNAIVINDGVYWFRNPGTSQPFNASSGNLRDLLPGYYGQFGNDTDRLALTGNGQNQLFLTKDGYFQNYGKNSNSQIYLISSGIIADLPGWSSAPQISGRQPLYPDGLLYGPLFKQSYNDSNSPTAANNPIPSTNQLIVFQKGAVWVKYDWNGPWEDWGPITLPPPPPTPTIFLTPTPTLPPLPTSTPIPTPTPIPPVSQALGFDQTKGDIATANQPKQTILSADGKVLYSRQWNSTWSNWGSVCVKDIGISGLTSIRAFDQSFALDGTARQTVIRADGSAMYTRLWNSGAAAWNGWSAATPTTVYGVPGLTAIANFDQTPGDAATGNIAKQTIITTDGATLWTRTAPNNVWGSWSSVSISALGSGASAIKSFNQTVIPGTTTPKQDMLDSSGASLVGRSWNSTWGTWGPVLISNLQIAPAVCP